MNTNHDKDLNGSSRGRLHTCAKGEKDHAIVTWDVPQARNKIKHSMCWLHKTLKVLQPNFRTFSGLSLKPEEKHSVMISQSITKTIPLLGN